MTKSAFVSIVGRPSAGKSSLVNALCGAKVSIVSPVPQTTRSAVRGIVTKDDCQIVFIDTPGIHLSEKKFNTRLTRTAAAALADADVALYLLDSTRAPGEEEAEIARRIQALWQSAAAGTGAAGAAAGAVETEAAGTAAGAAGAVETEAAGTAAGAGVPAGKDGGVTQNNTIIAINKIDAKNANPEACVSFIDTHFPGFPRERIVSISALRKTNLDTLLDRLRALAPEGPFFYDSDFYTDQEVPFRIAEIIREKCCLLLRDELPHALYIDVLDTQLRGTALSANVFIRCERESQKGIIVGKDGAMIQKIRAAAMADLKKIFDWSIKLDMRVKTDKNWRQRGLK